MNRVHLDHVPLKFYTIWNQFGPETTNCLFYCILLKYQWFLFTNRLTHCVKIKRCILTYKLINVGLLDAAEWEHVQGAGAQGVPRGYLSVSARVMDPSTLCSFHSTASSYSGQALFFDHTVLYIFFLGGKPLWCW